MYSSSSLVKGKKRKKKFKKFKKIQFGHRTLRNCSFDGRTVIFYAGQNAPATICFPQFPFSLADFGVTAHNITSTRFPKVHILTCTISDNRFNHPTSTEFLMQVSVLDQLTLRLSYQMRVCAISYQSNLSSPPLLLISPSSISVYHGSIKPGEAA